MKMKYILTISLIFTSIILTSFAQEDTPSEMSEYAIARFGKGGINAMQFSPDGTQLAIGTSIGVWLYDLRDGKETFLFTEQPYIIGTLAFSPNGNRLSVYSLHNATIQVWDMSRDFNQTPFTFPDRPGLINELVFSQDNNTLLGLSELGFMAEWDIKTGERLSTKKIGPLKSFASFSQNGKTFVYGDSEKNEIRIWDADSESLSEVFKGKSNPNERNGQQKVETVAYSPDNKTIVSAHIGNILKIWDTATKELRYNLKGHREIVNTFAFTPDSKILASGSSDNRIMLWDVNKGKRTATLSGHLNSVNTLSFSPTEDGLLASGSSDGTVRFWDTKTGKERSIFATGHIDSIEAVAFSKDNTRLCSAASNGTVHIWDVQTGEKFPPPSVPHYDSDSAVVLSQDATLLVCNGNNKIVSSRRNGRSMSRSHKDTQVSSLPTGDELISFPHPAVTLALSPDNNILAAVNPIRHAVQLWEINTGTELFSFDVALSLSEELTFSPNSKYLFIYGSDDGSQMWNLTTQQKINIPRVKEIGALAFSPDNTTIALIHYSAKGLTVISLWRITPTGIEKHKAITPEYRDGYTVKLLFSPDGKTLLRVQSNGRKNYITLWDIANSIELGTVSGHTGYIETLTFSHDGKMLASGSVDGTILLWDWERILQNIEKTKKMKK